MRSIKVLVVAVVLGSFFTGIAGAHEDHPVPSFSEGHAISTNFNSGGQDAEWELLASFATGNPHTDIDFFTQDGDTYASAGTLGIGPNGGGQTIVKLTEGDEVSPSYVSGHPSASCISNPKPPSDFSTMSNRARRAMPS